MSEKGTAVHKSSWENSDISQRNFFFCYLLFLIQSKHDFHAKNLIESVGFYLQRDHSWLEYFINEIAKTESF